MVGKQDQIRDSFDRGLQVQAPAASNQGLARIFRGPGWSMAKLDILVLVQLSQNFDMHFQA